MDSGINKKLFNIIEIRMETQIDEHIGHVKRRTMKEV